MKVLLTCATSGIGQSILSDSTGIDWVAASRSGKNDLTLDFDKPSTFKDVAKKAGELDGMVMIPPRITPPNNLFPEPDTWTDYFQQAFAKPIFFMKEILSGKKDLGLFKVVVINGLSSVHALSGYSTTNAMRLAWLGHMKSLALALGRDGLRLNTLSLGGVLTPSYTAKLRQKAERHGRSFEDQLMAETDNVPTGQYSTGEDVANAVVALLGSMSDQITGQNFVMDGGFFRGY